MKTTGYVIKATFSGKFVQDVQPVRGGVKLRYNLNAAEARFFQTKKGAKLFLDYLKKDGRLDTDMEIVRIEDAIIFNLDNGDYLAPSDAGCTVKCDNWYFDYNRRYTLAEMMGMTIAELKKLPGRIIHRRKLVIRPRRNRYVESMEATDRPCPA